VSIYSFSPAWPSCCRPITCALLSAVLTFPASANEFLDLTLGLHSDDNITRAFLDRDIHKDQSAELSVSGGKLFQLTPANSVTAFGSTSTTRFADLSGLHSNSISLGGSYQHKFGLGAYAPVVASALSWTHHDSHSQTRDREIVEWELSYGKRLSAAWNVTAGTVFEASKGIHDAQRHASVYSTRNDIYDFNQGSVFVAADYTSSNYAILSASYTWADGYTVSSALAPNPGLGSIARALTSDHAVPVPVGRKQVAYTLPSGAHLFDLNYSLPVGRDSSINAGVSRQIIKANRGVDYTNNRISLTFVHILF
jgi:hypothetical protein